MTKMVCELQHSVTCYAPTKNGQPAGPHQHSITTRPPGASMAVPAPADFTLVDFHLLGPSDTNETW